LRHLRSPAEHELDLLFGLRDVRPHARAMALPPEAIQLLHCVIALLAPFDKETADDRTRTPDASATVHVGRLPCAHGIFEARLDVDHVLAARRDAVVLDGLA